MDIAALRAKVTRGATVLGPRIQQARSLAQGYAATAYHALSPTQRLLGGSLLAIVMVAGMAALSLGSQQKGVSVSVPQLPTRVTVAAPTRPSTKAQMTNIPTVATTEPAAETQQISVPLSEQLRQFQNTPAQLSAVPIDGLTVATPDGLLPKIGPDGRLPWQAYARPTPVVPAAAPRLAVIITDMGLSERLTLPALEQLPGQVSVALNGQSPKIQDYIATTRANGHEVLLDIPAEPRFFPEEDPGPTALMTRIGTDANLKRLRVWLAKAQGIVGVMTSGGTQFVADGAAVTAVISELKLRGLAWFDSGDSRSVGTKMATSIKAANASVNIVLDDVLTPDAIRAKFDNAVAIAREHGSVLIMARPYPLTLSLLNEQLNRLPEAGIALVPASAMVIGEQPAVNSNTTTQGNPDAAAQPAIPSDHDHE